MRVVDQQALDFEGLVQAGDTVVWGQAGAEPTPLTTELMAQRHRIAGRFRIFLGNSFSDTVRPEHSDRVDFSSYCGSGYNRALAAAGLLDVLPVHYSRLPQVLRSPPFPVDVLLLQLSPPDSQGRYSFSIAHEYLVGLVDTARIVIAEVNELAPWTYGERYLTDADLDVVVRTSRRPLEARSAKVGPAEELIGRNVAELIPDGATLQLGIGAAPQAVLTELHGREDLGIHSGLIGDGVAELMEAGVITNARKTIDTGVTVAGVMLGGRSLYEFADRNEQVRFRSSDYTHNADVLRKIDSFVAINSALEVDLTGQINAEATDGIYVGAVGGAMDFLRGAANSSHGLPIVALPAQRRGVGTIVARLSGPVSTPRSDAGLFVTEHGVADVRGLPLSERISRMIAIADPQFRESLEREARS